MLYIITEDTGSGKQFWDAISKYIKYAGMECEVVATGGITGVYSIFLNLSNGINRIKSEDVIFLAVDCLLSNGNGDFISGSTAFDVAEMVRDVKELCKKLSCKLLIPPFYCYEEVLISYQHIGNLVGVFDSELYKVLSQVQVSIKENKDYWDDNTTSLVGVPGSLEYYRKVYNGVSKLLRRNREQFVAELLHRYTEQAKGRRVTVSKSTIGSCWLRGCITLQSSNKGVYTRNCVGCYWSTIFNDEIAKARGLLEDTLLYNIGESGFKEIVSCLDGMGDDSTDTHVFDI